MSTLKVQKVEFEIPSYSERVRPFAGWVCIGAGEGRWYSGCDIDSASDAYYSMVAQATSDDDSIFPHTVQMFRVDPA